MNGYKKKLNAKILNAKKIPEPKIFTSFSNMKLIKFMLILLNKQLLKIKTTANNTENKKKLQAIIPQMKWNTRKY